MTRRRLEVRRPALTVIVNESSRRLEDRSEEASTPVHQWCTEGDWCLGG